MGCSKCDRPDGPDGHVSVRLVDLVSNYGDTYRKYQKDVPPPPGSRGAEGSGIVKKMSVDRNYEIVPQLEEFAAERGHPVGELAIAWLTRPVLITFFFVLSWLTPALFVLGLTK